MKISGIMSRRSPSRRRNWKYISPRRQGRGVAMLAILLGMMYGYWYLTNDRQIRTQAEKYLERLTGGQADRQGALQLLRRDRAHQRSPDGRGAAGRRPAPVFEAKSVLLRHHPWTIFLKWKLQPTEITCQESSLTLDRSLMSGDKLAGITPAHEEGAQPPEVADMPPISFRGGQLRLTNSREGKVVDEDISKVDILLKPHDPGVYQIQFEKQPTAGEEAIRGELLFDMMSGKITVVSGGGWITNIQNVLPQDEQKWIDRYSIKGKFQVKGSASLGSGPSGLQAELADVSLKLPDDEGGLEFTHVSGVIAFEQDHVRIKNMVGQIPGAGGTSFKLNGRYDGLSGDSPFKMEIQIDGLSLPGPQVARGALAQWLKKAQEDYDPRGKGDLVATFKRLPGGAFEFSGTIKPQGMSFKVARFPYRIEEVYGQVDIQPAMTELRDISARHGSAVLRRRAGRRGQ